MNSSRGRAAKVLPALTLPPVDQPVVHPPLAALPELHDLGPDPEAAPLRRHGDLDDVGEPLLARRRTARRARRATSPPGTVETPRRRSATPWAARRSRPGSPRRRPATRCPRPGPGAAGRATGTAARAPGWPRSRGPCASRSWCRTRSPLVQPLEQHHPGGRAAFGGHRGHDHRVGLVESRPDGVVEPTAEHLERIRLEVRDVEPVLAVLAPQCCQVQIRIRSRS